MLQNIQLFGEIFTAKKEIKEKKDGTGTYEEVKIGYRTKEGVGIFNKTILNRKSQSPYVVKMNALQEYIVDRFEAKEKVFVKWNTKPIENKETKELNNFNLFSTYCKDGKYGFTTEGFLDIVDFVEEGEEIFYQFTSKNGGTYKVNSKEIKDDIEIEAICEMTDGNIAIFTDGKTEYPNEIHGILSPRIMDAVGNQFEQGVAYKFKCAFEKGKVVKGNEDSDVYSFDEEVKTDISFETDKLIITNPLGKSRNIKIAESDSWDF